MCVPLTPGSARARADEIQRYFAAVISASLWWPQPSCLGLAGATGPCRTRAPSGKIPSPLGAAEIPSRQSLKLATPSPPAPRCQAEGPNAYLSALLALTSSGPLYNQSTCRHPPRYDPLRLHRDSIWQSRISLRPALTKIGASLPSRRTPAMRSRACLPGAAPPHRPHVSAAIAGASQAQDRSPNAVLRSAFF